MLYFLLLVICFPWNIPVPSPRHNFIDTISEECRTTHAVLVVAGDLLAVEFPHGLALGVRADHALQDGVLASHLADSLRRKRDLRLDCKDSQDI